MGEYLGAGLVAAIALLMCAAPAATAGIEWYTTEADLGYIYRDEPQKASFGFVNTSSETIYFNDIEPSCDCTTAQPLPQAVPPHGSGEILMFMDPAGYEGKGRITEFIRVTTSDVGSPDVELRFSVEVGIGPEPEPRALNFGRVCVGDSDTLSLRIDPGWVDTLRILGTDTGSDCVMIERAGDSHEGFPGFRVIVCNLDCRGNMSSFVTVHTNDPIRKQIRVPVTANLMGTIVIDPEVVAFGPTLPGKFVAQPVRIYCTEGLKFDIGRITCSVASIECSAVPSENNTYEIKIRIKEGAPAGRVAGQIIVETDCEDQPLLTAKVTGYVRSDNQ